MLINVVIPQQSHPDPWRYVGKISITFITKGETNMCCFIQNLQKYACVFSTGVGQHDKSAGTADVFWLPEWTRCVSSSVSHRRHSSNNWIPWSLQAKNKTRELEGICCKQTNSARCGWRHVLLCIIFWGAWGGAVSVADESSWCQYHTKNKKRGPYEGSRQQTNEMCWIAGCSRRWCKFHVQSLVCSSKECSWCEAVAGSWSWCESRTESWCSCRGMLSQKQWFHESTVGSWSWCQSKEQDGCDTIVSCNSQRRYLLHEVTARSWGWCQSDELGQKQTFTACHLPVQHGLCKTSASSRSWHQPGFTRGNISIEAGSTERWFELGFVAVGCRSWCKSTIWRRILTVGRSNQKKEHKCDQVVAAFWCICTVHCQPKGPCFPGNEWWHQRARVASVAVCCWLLAIDREISGSDGRRIPSCRLAWFHSEESMQEGNQGAFAEAEQSKESLCKVPSTGNHCWYIRPASKACQLSAVGSNPGHWLVHCPVQILNGSQEQEQDVDMCWYARVWPCLCHCIQIPMCDGRWCSLFGLTRVICVFACHISFDGLQTVWKSNQFHASDDVCILHVAQLRIRHRVLLNAFLFDSSLTAVKRLTSIILVVL